VIDNEENQLNELVSEKESQLALQNHADFFELNINLGGF